MPIAYSDIVTELANRGYPTLLTSGNVQAATDAALREFNAFTVQSNFGVFTCVPQQQDYYIFDNTKPEGIAANALDVKQIYWNPSGDFSSPDIFSPGYQLFSTIIIYGSNTFDNPSDMTILRGKLDAWSRQFGNQGWKLFGQPGSPDAFIRLYPVPTMDCVQVIVEWTSATALSGFLSLNLGWGRKLMQWVELKCAELLARKYAETAGTELVGIKDGVATLKFWQTEVERLRKLVIDTQGGGHAGVIDRT